MVPATLGLGYPRDYQIDRPCPQFVKGQAGLGVRGRQVVVDVFPEGIAELYQQRGV